MRRSRCSWVALRCTAEVERVTITSMFTIYVLYNSTAQKTYTGQTEDLERRINQHNNHQLGKFTACYRGKWVLIYQESVATRTEALKREKQLKSGNGRMFIKQFIPG